MDLLHRISSERLRQDLDHLCRTLPFRKVIHTRPGQSRHTLAETDDYLLSQLRSAGIPVTTTTHRVQPFRCDSTKPLHHWYAPPHPADPFCDVQNLEAILPGHGYHADEIIQLIAHKDSMSWIDSPGAHDNAVGTVALLELARVLATCHLSRSIRLLFCNEEHTPWTSRFAAEASAARGDHIIAVLNVDSIDGKSDAERTAGRLTHVIAYSTDEGKALADRMLSIARRHIPDLEVRSAFKDHINDDDGMFILAGFRAAVMNIGSWPYADPEYHLPGDTPDRVNLHNLTLSTQLLLATILDLSATVSSPNPGQ